MRWLSYLNVVLVVILICVGILFFFYSPTNEEITSFLPRLERKELPKSAFAPPDEEYDLEEGPLALKWVPPLMQLPDLRGELQFFGQNGRPDVAQKRSSYHLGLKSSEECRTICSGERVYLVYQGNYTNRFVDRTPYREPITPSQRPLWGDVATSNKGSYVFSPDNQPTPLWLETCSGDDTTISLQVNMLDEKGGLVKTPQARRQITLRAEAFPKSQINHWELGGFRVDSTLLVRQKARWVGSDIFLEMHGGEEFSFTLGRERIDFLGSEKPYSCFIGPEDYLIWKEGRWMTPLPGEETEKFPLLCVRKIDEKILSLELWDSLGRSKTVLSLIRSKDHQKPPNLTQEFKFVGAKTWAQFIVECRQGGRLTLKPNDWLILTQDGWKKIDTPDEIDEYVDRELLGPLFILDKMKKHNGRQILVGHLFNTSRTEVEIVELEAATNTSLANYYRAMPLAPPIKPQLEGEEE